jgi:Flp pilus assembly protein TadB
MLHKRFMSVLLLSFCLLWPVAFVGHFIILSQKLLLFTAPLAACCLALAFKRYLIGKDESARLSQFQQLLAHLASRVAAGQTLEHALTDAAPTLEKELGPRNLLVQALRTLRQQMMAHMSVKAALAGLSAHFRLSRITTQLSVLVPLSRHGGRLDIFLRRSHDALNRERQMQLDVAAERSQTSSETTVLLFLPFVVAAAMAGQYRSDLIHEPWYPFVSVAVFFLTIAAACVAMLILAPEREAIKKKTKKKKKMPPLKKYPRFLLALYVKRLPAGIGYRLQRMAENVYPEMTTPFERHLAKKPRLLLTGLLLGLLLQMTTDISWLIYPLVFILPVISHDYDLWRREKSRIESYRLLLPVMLNLLAVLLESGLTLDTALQVLPLEHVDETPPSCGYALKEMRHKLQLGEPSDQVLTDLADQCPIPDLSAALHLAARYQRLGGSELIDLLQQTAENSWQVYRHAVRLKLEKRSLLLMIPMGLDLLAVIAIAIMPAIASFSIY